MSRGRLRASVATPLPRLDAPDFMERCAAWLAPDADVPQNPRWHGEGDVRAHTLLVLEALQADPQWQALDALGQEDLAWAALLHDIGKRHTTRPGDDGAPTSPRHAQVGEVMVRGILADAGVPWHRRERICALVGEHMFPARYIDRPEPEATRRLRGIAERASIASLAMLARADTRGRIAPDGDDALAAIAVFVAAAEADGCTQVSYPFASDAARVAWFADPTRDPRYAPFEPADRPTLTLLVGAPASGKDHWCRAHARGRAEISLDAIRIEREIAPSDPQGAVIQEARVRLRRHLAAREDVIWNATNLSRRIRAPLCALARDYGARTEMVVMETPPAIALARNAARPDPVPDAALARMRRHWEMPDLREAERLWIVSDGQTTAYRRPHM